MFVIIYLLLFNWCARVASQRYWKWLLDASTNKQSYLKDQNALYIVIGKITENLGKK